MEKTNLGRTGLEVSRLGVGMAEIGTGVDAEEAGEVLNAALDAGISFLDTAACYGDSEELAGGAVAGRRDEFTLATKAGHSTGGYDGPAWTAQTVTDSIERSLRRLRTDHVDIVQLHSCDIDVLEAGDVIGALQGARDAGKTRFIGYSGDNEAARWAVDSGLFDTLQTSFNLIEQHARTKGLLAAAEAAGMGVIAKRPIGNGAWRAPDGGSRLSSYARQYLERAIAMAEMGPIADEPDDPILTALGFVFAQPEIDTAIVGTRNPAHMRANISLISEELPVSSGVIEELCRRFDALGADWAQRG